MEAPAILSELIDDNYPSEVSSNSEKQNFVNYINNYPENRHKIQNNREISSSQYLPEFLNLPPTAAGLRPPSQIERWMTRKYNNKSRLAARPTDFPIPREENHSLITLKQEEYIRQIQDLKQENRILKSLLHNMLSGRDQTVDSASPPVSSHKTQNPAYPAERQPTVLQFRNENQNRFIIPLLSKGRYLDSRLDVRKPATSIRNQWKRGFRDAINKNINKNQIIK